MAMHNQDKVNAAYERLAAAVRAAEGAKIATPHIGLNNVKTSAVNEGTTPGITCAACAKCSCARECYAIWHEDIFYTACRRNHAENTVLRRRDALAYYRAFFAAAAASGSVLRLNETGDFETVEQLAAAAAAARAFPSVRALAYTRREFARGYKLPPNLRVVYSLYRGADENGDACRACDCVSMVREDITTCPAQIRADVNKRRKAEGLVPLPAWTCAACAAAKIGCWGRSAVVFRAH